MPTLFWDNETRSEANLEKVGAWRYARHPTTEVLCVSFAVDDGDPKIWTPGQPIPWEFHAAAGDLSWHLVAHNAQFERAIEKCVLHPRYGWPLFADSQRRCTMAAALANSLPGSLDKCAAALDFDERVFLRQNAQGLTYGDAADSQFAAEFALGWKLCSRRVLTACNALRNSVLHLVIEGYNALLTFQHVGSTITQ